MPISRSLGALAALSLLQCACQAPPPTLPAAPAGAALAALPEGASSQAPGGNWWSLYHDPALDHWVSQALLHNQDLAQADARLAALLAGVREQQAAQGPGTELGLSDQFGKTTADQTLAQAKEGSAPAQWAIAPSAGLRWQLDLFGQVRAAIAAAQANASAGAAARDQLRLVVAAQTTLAWLDVCGYGEQYTQANAAVEGLQASLALVERQRRAGVATELDSVRLGALLQRSEARLPWLRAQQRMASAQLALLTGQPVSAPAAYDCARVASLAGRLPAGDGWALLLRRPDVRQAQRRLLAASWTAQQVRADLYPQVTFAAGWAASSHHARGLGDASAVSFGVGPLVSWQFPNRRANQARVAAANAEREACAAAWRGTVLAALAELRQAMARYSGEQQRRLALGRAQAAAERASTLAERNYRAGALDGLARLDAQRAAIDARLSQAQARLRQAHSEVAVFQALGGGWQSETYIEEHER